MGERRHATDPRGGARFGGGGGSRISLRKFAERVRNRHYAGGRTAVCVQTVPGGRRGRARGRERRGRLPDRGAGDRGAARGRGRDTRLQCRVPTRRGGGRTTTTGRRRTRRRDRPQRGGVPRSRRDTGAVRQLLHGRQLPDGDARGRRRRLGAAAGPRGVGGRGTHVGEPDGAGPRRSGAQPHRR
ncbi:MAG: hypothetical protein J07HB67_01949 [halophilic archaeon J07HB67]|nr:MAG: hypothetical protein J07HB67_01949 [halophilic archaeon J07HB67]